MHRNLIGFTAVTLTFISPIGGGVLPTYAGDAKISEHGSLDALGHARELRLSLGLDADEATLTTAAVDPAAFPVTTLGIPMTKAEGAEIDRRLRVQVGLDGAVTAGEQSPHWAGAWIDQAAGGLPVFQFDVSDPAAVSEVSSSLPPGTPFATRVVTRSLAQIQAVRDQVLSDVAFLRELGVEVVGSGTDIPGNRATVSVARLDPDIEAILRERYGDDIHVREGHRVVADACPVDGCLPMKGGLGIIGKSALWPCTVGYVARRTDVNPDTFVLVTAGHCVQYGSGLTGNPWHHGATNIGYGINSPAGGKIETFFNNSSADVGLVSMFSNIIPVTKNQVLVDDSPVVVRPATQVKSWNLQLPGSIVCRMGMTTKHQCGTIIDNDETRISEVAGIASANIQHTVVYGRDADGGDSGGTMFVRVEDPEGPYAVLYGTHVHSDDGYVPSGGQGWYSPIDRGIAQIQATHAPVTLRACLSSTCP